MVLVRALTIIFWLVIACYAGVAGYVACKAVESTATSAADESVEYHGLNFENGENLQQFLHDSEVAKLFPWIFAVPQECVPLITSAAFGLLGGAIVTLKKLAIDQLRIPSSSVFTLPVFGAVVGMMLYFLSFLLPAIFISGRSPTRPESLVGLSCLGGAFSEQAFRWMKEQVEGKIFPSKAPKKAENNKGKS